MKRKIFLCALAMAICTFTVYTSVSGQTDITKWQFGKRGAVSITYDGGSLNQFRKALPIMNRLGFPATFFIVTGVIPGSQYQGKFIGRPIKEIIDESGTIPTNKDSYLERSSAAPYLGYTGTLEYHTDAGNSIETGKLKEAYKIIDDLYSRVRNGDFPPGNRINQEVFAGRGVTWDEIRLYATQGHEMASHTITHPQMAALDHVNLLYELEKSAEEIRNQLNQKYVFSAECPYATEDERVMQYSFKAYPALRNRMPERFLTELNRSNRKNPGSFSSEYVQWQRGAITKTPLQMMNSWIDTTVANKNIWLVLAFHGVDGIGWEALNSELLDVFFSYIKSKEEDLWVATFADVTKYMRERMNATVKTSEGNKKILVSLTITLDPDIYDIPLTLKSYVPSSWKEVLVEQGGEKKRIYSQRDSRGSYVLYQIRPNSGILELTVE